MCNVVNSDKKLKTNGGNPVLFDKTVTSVEWTVRLPKPSPGYNDPNTTKRSLQVRVHFPQFYTIRGLITVLYTRLAFVSHSELYEFNTHPHTLFL
jgi:hypothetical protein